MLLLSGVLATIGGLSLTMCLWLIAWELITRKTVRPPKRQPFSSILLAERQYQNVVAPAFGALASGLFVSLAASFLYAGMEGGEPVWHSLVGTIMFFMGALALALTLVVALKDSTEPSRLVRDAFTIRAAAEESASDPRRGLLAPDKLTMQLDKWEQQLSIHALNLKSGKQSDLLDRSLKYADKAGSYLWLAWAAFRIYIAACLRFPVRFGWPYVGLIAWTSGCALLARLAPETGVDEFWHSSMVGVLSFGFGSIIVLAYSVARGHRARLWHRIHLDALWEARNAIADAEIAYKRTAAEDAQLERILASAAEYLQEWKAGDHPGAPSKGIRLGRVRVSILPRRSARTRASSGGVAG